jgi:hypothetical protein
VPNLNADRGIWLARLGLVGNVRRLMYQSLIWAGMLRDYARRLRSPLDSEGVQRLTNALVDRVGRNPELGGDLLGAQVLIDEPEAVELPGGQARNALRHRILCHLRSSPVFVRRAVSVFQRSPHLAQHCATPEQRVWACLVIRGDFAKFSANSYE